MKTQQNETIPSYGYFSEEQQAVKSSCYLVGYHRRNPMNHGALIRLGDNVGAHKVFFTADPNRFSMTRIKKTAGSSHTHMPFAFSTLDKIIEEIPPDHQWVAVETSAKAEMIYSAVLPEKCVFVVGNETNGLPPDMLRHCQKHVYIPMPGHTKSMNVSHAAAVVLFEWLRRHY
ncbi:MAG: TrmH family RNA methyltransferase [Bacteroidales bacterium]|nr:TrmH family RNA methyltransferase [Bacteroidales bacterium]